MRQPHHEFFYICIGIALFCVIFIIVVYRISIHIRQFRFLENTFMTSIELREPNFSKVHDEFLRKKEKVFSFGRHFIGATYIQVPGGWGRYFVRCYYNGKTCICFQYDIASGNSYDEWLLTDTYITVPLPKNFDGADLWGHSVDEVYARLGPPAAAGLFDDQRILIYLLRGELFLSDYTYWFYINSEGIVEKVELHQYKNYFGV